MQVLFVEVSYPLVPEAPSDLEVERLAKRCGAIRAESGPLRKQRKGPDESMAEMRALLSEEQRPIFDMNRARLAAESQQSQKRPRKKRRSVVEAE